MKKPIKKCKNPDCGDDITEYKSSKKIFCNDYCRNHAGHLKRKIEDEEFKTYQKGLKDNYVLLKIFYDKQIGKIEFNLAEKLGFNTKYLPEKKFYTINGRTTGTYNIKEITFKLSKDNTEIELFKKIN